MSNRKRNHGIFSVADEVVEMIQAKEQQEHKGKPIAEALETIIEAANETKKKSLNSF